MKILSLAIAGVEDRRERCRTTVSALIPGGGHYKDHLNKTIIKLRGDGMDDYMRHHYPQDWCNAIRQLYLDTIHHFGIYD